MYKSCKNILNRKLVIYDESDFGEGEMKEISPGHFVLKPYKGER